MIPFRVVRRRMIPFLLAGVAALPAAAQTGNGAAPQTLPGLDTFSLPPSQPAVTPTPAPVIAPLPTPSPSPLPRVTPTPGATPTPRATPAPRASATPAPAPTPEAASAPAASTPPASVPTSEPSATPTPSPTPSSLPTAAPSVAPGEEQGDHGWLIGLGLLAVAGGAGAWWWRRNRTASEPVRPIDDAGEAPLPTPRPMPVRPVITSVGAAPVADAPAVPIGDRARLTLTLNPRRGGLNLLSATVEAELVVRNTGTAPATAIRIGAILIGATPGQGDEIAPLFAQPIGRPATPPFTLAPGEERRVRLVVAQPRGEILALSAGGRTMFVPVVAINALFEAGEGAEGQSARAFAVGVERVDSAKLAPFWLDQPARMHEQLAVRPYGAGVER